MNPIFNIPEDFAALSLDELRAWIENASETAEAVAASPSDYIGEGRSSSELMEEMTEGVAAIEAARAELAKREAEEEPEEETEPEAEATVSEEEAEQLAALASRVTAAQEPEPESEPESAPEPEPESAPEPEAAAPAVTAAAPASPAPASPRLPRPSRSRISAPPAAPRVVLTAAAENLGYGLGEEIPDGHGVAAMMSRRRRQFGSIAEGTHGEKIPIARAEWGDLYPDERQLSQDVESNWEKVQAVTAGADILRAFEERRKEAGGSLVASGGLCAPVTPYYNLQQLSVADRPVRAALPSFNADRGGINFARPAALSAVTTAVGVITEAEDAAGGTTGAKTCQVVPCPTFQEVDVSAVFHCIQFGNMAARTFPELVAQWNQLVLAAHARAAETELLDRIATNSTQVTAIYTAGFGASGDLLGQILAAAAGMRSRHRMSPDAVLRALLPQWILDLLVSDVYRSQFGRFEMTPERFVSLIRAGNVEPSFYMDGATGAGQVFATQGAGALSTFPTTAEWYLYPEGSFLYLDGGVLELGLVRDSVLNETNDFQIFGETFENVAFVGVESLEVRSQICDSGAASLPIATGCPNYA